MSCNLHKLIKSYIVNEVEVVVAVIIACEKLRRS